MKDQFRSDARIGAITVPTLVQHGELDRVAPPIAFGERLYAAIRAPKRFVRFAKGEHEGLDAHGAIAAVRLTAAPADRDVAVPVRSRPGVCIKLDTRRAPPRWQASAWTRRWSSSGCVLLYPRYIPVHPPLEKLPACCADAAICLEQPILRLDKGLGLAKCRHIKICMVRRCCWATAVPTAPIEMPMTPAGLPAQALWP